MSLHLQLRSQHLFNYPNNISAIWFSDDRLDFCHARNEVGCLSVWTLPQSAFPQFSTEVNDNKQQMKEWANCVDVTMDVTYEDQINQAQSWFSNKVKCPALITWAEIILYNLKTNIWWVFNCLTSFRMIIFKCDFSKYVNDWIILHQNFIPSCVEKALKMHVELNAGK